MTKVEITEWGETDLVKWHQFSEAISKLAIVAGIITIITKGINK